MAQKVTMETLFNVLEEIDKGANDNTRTIEDIEDEEVREFINSKSELAATSDFPKRLRNGITAGGVVIAGGAGAVLAGGGIAAGVKIGAAAGAPGGPIGIVIGVVLVGGVGFLAGWLLKKKMQNEKQRLNQEVAAKQNGVIVLLQKEKEEMEQNVEIMRQNLERYKYLVGLLMAYIGIVDFCSA